MKSRRNFLKHVYIGISLLITSLIGLACGLRPDAETEPSPEWPSKDENE